MQQLETGGRDDIGIAPRTLHLVLFPSQRTELPAWTIGIAMDGGREGCTGMLGGGWPTTITNSNICFRDKRFTAGCTHHCT